MIYDALRLNALRAHFSEPVITLRFPTEQQILYLNVGVFWHVRRDGRCVFAITM